MAVKRAQRDGLREEMRTWVGGEMGDSDFYARVRALSDAVEKEGEDADAAVEGVCQFVIVTFKNWDGGRVIVGEGAWERFRYDMALLGSDIEPALHEERGRFLWMNALCFGAWIVVVAGVTIWALGQWRYWGLFIWAAGVLPFLVWKIAGAKRRKSSLRFLTPGEWEALQRTIHEVEIPPYPRERFVGSRSYHRRKLREYAETAAMMVPVMAVIVPFLILSWPWQVAGNLRFREHHADRRG